MQTPEDYTITALAPLNIAPKILYGGFQLEFHRGRFETRRPEYGS
jgi:hypothetical protein